VTNVKSEEIYLNCVLKYKPTTQISLSYNTKDNTGKEYVGQGLSIPFVLKFTDSDITLIRYYEGKLRKFDVINYIDGKEFKTAQSLHDYLKDKKEIEVFFRRPSLNEERKITFTNFHEKIEVKDVKMLRFE